MTLNHESLWFQRIRIRAKRFRNTKLQLLSQNVFRFFDNLPVSLVVRDNFLISMSLAHFFEQISVQSLHDEVMHANSNMLDKLLVLAEPLDHLGFHLKSKQVHLLNELRICVHEMVVISVNMSVVFMRCAWVVFSEEVLELGHEFVLDGQDEEFNKLDWVMLVELEALNDLDSLVPFVLERHLLVFGLKRLFGGLDWVCLRRMEVRKEHNSAHRDLLQMLLTR